MEVTGNIYDDVRKGNTTQTYAITDAQAEDPQTKISGASKWAHRTFTALAILGWIVAGVLILDAILFNSQIMCWIMIGK